MKRYLRSIVGGLLAGCLGLGAAVAGVGLSPIGTEKSITAQDLLRKSGISLTATSASVPNPGDVEITPEEVSALVNLKVPVPSGTRLASDFLVGASRGSFYPAPTLFGGNRWQTAGCTSMGVDGSNTLDRDHAVASMEDIKGWPAASPDCIYLGGFGLGPVRPAASVDPGGVWVRSVAISNGEKTFLYQITDTVGWFARYDSSICADCGLLDIRQKIAADVGTSVDDLVIASTHSHATADTYGGWGGLPDWYRRQLRDTVIASAKQAIANLTPASISVGEAQLRNRNGERRDTYLSNADTEATWLQAKALPDGNGNAPVIATLSTYAAHPTIVGAKILHADWPGAAARRFEAIYGGVGLLFEGSLGNVSVSRMGGPTESQDAENTGNAIANDVAVDINTEPKALGANVMASSVKPITHPVLTNPGLTTLSSAGLFDREFAPGTPGADGPGAYHWSKPFAAGTTNGTRGEPVKPKVDDTIKGLLATTRSCDTAGPVQIKTVAGAHRIGGLLIGFTPGEIFSNISEVAKENSNNSTISMIFGQSNDALGYIIQSFEYDKLGNAVTEYGTQNGEYEEVFAIDHCFGDHVLDVLLTSITELGMM